MTPCCPFCNKDQDVCCCPTYDAALRQLSELRVLLREIVIHKNVGNETICDVGYCRYCKALNLRKSKHSADCPIIRARTLLNIQGADLV